MPNIVKQGDCMFGTSHWYGTVDGYPAVVTSWHGGAALWAFVGGEWAKYRKFEHLAAALEWLEPKDKD